MLAHNAVLRVHCHATEDEDRVRRALALLAGDLEPARSLAEGHFKNPIVVLEVAAERRQALAVWERIRAFPPVAAQLRAEAERRVDDFATAYARFDKQRAYQGELALTQGDDAIHLRSKLAAFPSKKGPAVQALVEFLAGGPGQPPQP